MTWAPLATAPLRTLVLLWSPKYPDRTDIVGRVIEYPDGERLTSAPCSPNIKLTHWHPLPAPPAAEHA